MYKVGDVLYCIKCVEDFYLFKLFKEGKNYTITNITHDKHLFHINCDSTYTYSFSFTKKELEEHFVNSRELKLKKILR